MTYKLTRSYAGYAIILTYCGDKALVQRTDSVFRMVLSFPFLPTIVVGREKRANR